VSETSHGWRESRVFQKWAPRLAQQQFDMPGMLAWISFFFAFALLLEALLQRGMKRYFRWRPEAA
jgi:hypothetical protein